MGDETKQTCARIRSSVEFSGQGFGPVASREECRHELVDHLVGSSVVRSCLHGRHGHRANSLPAAAKECSKVEFRSGDFPTQALLLDLRPAVYRLQIPSPRRSFR